MKFFLQKILLLILIIFSFSLVSAQTDSLDNYIQRLRNSLATGGSETAYLSIGSDFLYAQDYFEAGEYSSAFYQFKSILRKDKDHPYANYQLAASLLKQNDAEKTKLAQMYLDNAFKLLPELKERYQKDFPTKTTHTNTNKPTIKTKTTTSKTPKEKETPKTPVVNKPTTKPTQSEYGGELVYGNYTCHVTVWRGPNMSPAYRYDYKGYFALKKDGTYRWLDDGATGKFTYDKTTGKLNWVSGYFKGNQPKKTEYQVGKKMAQITITFSDNLRWECGCEK